MVAKTRYRYLEDRHDKGSNELFVRGMGVRASTIWHDRYISLLAPDLIAEDRDMPKIAVLEALQYCLENWESIAAEKELEHKRLDEMGFFAEASTEGP